jgi:hypothetical protein
MQLEAEEPADAGFAASGQAGKHPVAVDPTRVTRKRKLMAAYRTDSA